MTKIIKAFFITNNHINDNSKIIITLIIKNSNDSDNDNDICKQ